MARILTGIQSTGTPHLGNVLGAIRPAIQLAQAVNVFGPVQDQDGLIKKWFSPECPTYEERAAAAVDRCNVHCVNRSAVGFEALQHVVDERSASLANSSVEAAEALAAELANRTLANALLDLDLDVALIIESGRGRRLQCNAACSNSNNAWTVKCAQTSCAGCAECTPPPPSPRSPPPLS